MTTPQPPTIAPSELAAFITDMPTALGVPSEDAGVVADSLVKAELWGHSSHGMLRLPWYVERLRSGAMTKVTRPAVVRDSGSLLVLDGKDGTESRPSAPTPGPSRPRPDATGWR